MILGVPPSRFPPRPGCGYGATAAMQGNHRRRFAEFRHSYLRSSRPPRSSFPGVEIARRIWPTGGLWRHADFLKLWSAETVSQFGTQISQLALPLAAIDVLHASAFEVAALTTVEFLPFLLVSLPAGVWVDRLPRRPILIAGDLARAGLLASIPIAYFFDALTIWQL